MAHEIRWSRAALNVKQAPTRGGIHPQGAIGIQGLLHRIGDFVEVAGPGVEIEHGVARTGVAVAVLPHRTGVHDVALPLLESEHAQLRRHETLDMGVSDENQIRIHLFHHLAAFDGRIQVGPFFGFDR